MLSTSKSIIRLFGVEDFQREIKNILYLVFEYLGPEKINIILISTYFLASFCMSFSLSALSSIELSWDRRGRPSSLLIEPSLTEIELPSAFSHHQNNHQNNKKLTLSLLHLKIINKLSHSTIKSTSILLE
ncbi:hypothetical protein R6Q59_032033 [Mikania micrantha]